LGLLRYPPLEITIGLCASDDPDIRPVALRYFLDNVTIRYPHYDPVNFGDLLFIPSSTRLGSPKEVRLSYLLTRALITGVTQVFSNPEWALFGLLVVHPGIQPHDVPKLKLREHPPASLLIDLLSTSPPTNHAEATKFFGTLAGRIAGKF
jgi:hypothetical protein